MNVTRADRDRAARLAAHPGPLYDTVRCPLCGAVAGERCDVRRGARQAHLARADKAVALMTRQRQAMADEQFERNNNS